MSRERARAAVLSCGRELQYESAWMTPRPGQTVPCMTHGYCLVADVARRQEEPERRARRRRTTTELLEHLSCCSGVSLASLRRHGFTLRVVAEAERDGSVRMIVDRSVDVVRVELVA